MYGGVMMLFQKHDGRGSQAFS